MIKFIKDNIMVFLVTIMLIVLLVWSAQIISERDDDVVETTQQSVCNTSIKGVVNND